MTDEPQNPGTQELSVSQSTLSKPAKRPKPGPGRHGSGQITPSAPAPTPSAIHSASPKSSPARVASPASAPTPTASLPLPPAPANSPLTKPPAKPAPKRKHPAAKASKPGPLGLEDTINFATALTVPRGPFFIVHVEVTGPNPDPDNNPDEILAISALQVDEGGPVSEFSVQVGEHGALLQEAMTQLCEFLGSSPYLQVFAHGAAATQSVLGQAARQYGLLIENSVGDVVDLAKLAWPDRTDYSLSGLVPNLRVASLSKLEAPNATKAILDVLLATSKVLTAPGGRVSSSLAYWGTSADCVQIRMTPW